MKQGVDLLKAALDGDEEGEDEEEAGASEKEEKEEEGVRHTLVIPLSQILPCTTCRPAAAALEKEISGDSKALKRRHSCPSLTSPCPSWTEEKEEAAFAQTFLCRYREDEDFEDEGLGLGIVASQLPLLPATAILGSDWQEREQTSSTNPGNLRLSMESVAWDFEGLGR